MPVNELVWTWGRRRRQQGHSETPRDQAGYIPKFIVQAREGLLKSQFCGTWIQCGIYQIESPDRQAQAWGGGDFVVTIYLRRRLGTDRLFRATQGSVWRLEGTPRGWKGATGSPSRSGRTPTGGRRAAWGAWARPRGAGMGRRHGGGGGFALRKQGERGARRRQLPGSRSPS